MTEGGQDRLYTAITEDGSLSLVSGTYTELYHNRAGAFTEALLSYSKVAYGAWRIIYGDQLPQSINVLDCCFGLGYNSFVLAQEAPAGVSLDITGIEIDPCVIELLPRILGQSCFKRLAATGLDANEAVRLSQSGETTIANRDVNSTLHLNLVQGDLRVFLSERQSALAGSLDLILHDPFSPKKMAELWTIDLFSQYKHRLKDSGIILTYSSAPAVRGALQDLGFTVYRTPAQGGKSCGTLAILGDCLEEAVRDDRLANLVMPLAADELKRLGKSSRVPYRDPDLNFDRERIVAARVEEQKAFNKLAVTTSSLRK